MTEPAIHTDSLAYAYPDGRQAVREVSLRVTPGESVGLVGPNGAGKTTLLLLLAGLLEPSAGDLRIFGKRFGKGDERSVRRHLGFVFQETEDQLFSPTVFDDVAFGILNFADDERSLEDEAVRAKVAGTLAQVGLAGFEDRVPHHLSSGERRRVALATVLSYGPDVLILDEPSNDLDPRGRRELAVLLRSTSHARLVASHDLEFILRTCDRAVILEEGRVRADGPATRILADQALLEKHGLEIPLGLRGRGPEALAELLRGEREWP